MKNLFLFFSTALVVLLTGCSAISMSGNAPYYSLREPIQCVPYAREASGIPIRGDAHTWWRQAAGRYERGSVPKVGAVMVLSKTERLKYGHVAVVTKIIDSRNIEVQHANWGGDHKTRRIVYKAMPVKDVSATNDWSRSRFWHYPSKTYGSVYPTSGFIYAP
tara:strand:+ start:1071 stop:1556 length:486 start_codon:yes stop_codon:yes gene_type:complete